MSLVDSLDRWTESAREIFKRFDDLVAARGVYVSIILSGWGRLWALPFWGEPDIDEAFSRSREVVSELHGYLVVHDGDLAARWTVLAFLHDLSLEPSDEDERDWYLPDRDEADRARFREEFEALISLPEVAGLADPKRVRWEIQNSCLVSDFARVEGLFRRLEEIEPGNTASNDAPQGEFHLLRALSADPGDLLHCAVGLALPDSALAVRLARWGVALDDATGLEDRSGLQEARHFFEKAARNGFSLPGHAAAALGRCLFIDESYGPAAAIFSGILGAGGVALEGEQAGFNDELNAALHLAVARCHERAGERVKAKVALDKCLEAFPTHGPAFRRLAELSITADADYRAAYEVLARWADKEPQLESDVWVRTLRGLGGIKGEHSVERMLDEFFDAHPKRLEWVESAVRTHWPALDGLGGRARRQWLNGCWILWWRPPGFEAVEYANAAVHFSKALEIELRERVFAAFVDSLGADLTGLRADLHRPGRRLHERAKWAWGRLLEGKGGLGDMLTELDPSRESVLLVSTRFRQWLKDQFPKLVGRFVKTEAEQISQVRNPSTHEGEETRPRAEDASALCRKYLEYLLSPA